MKQFVEQVGLTTRGFLADLGYASRSFLMMLSSTKSLWRRPQLVADQIDFIGNYLLLIIAVAGLFVGIALGYQGYYST